MQAIRNLLHSDKRHSAATTTDAPSSARPSEDKAAQSTLASHHEGGPTSAQHLSPPAVSHHRGHRRNVSEATAATSARSSLDATPADANLSGSRRVSRQIEYENALPGMKPPMARTVEHAGRQGFTSSGVMGYEGLSHDVL